MIKLDFNRNQNGRLFLDCFGEILPQREENFNGNELQAWLKSIYLGVVKVEAVETMEFSDIRNAHTYAIYGEPLHVVSGRLKLFYKDEVNFPNCKLHLVAFSYVSRNIEVHNTLIEEWWKDRSNYINKIN